MVPFAVETRNTKKNNQLRYEGIIPGVIYGGKENISIQVPLAEFRKVLHEAGRNNLLQVSIGSKKLLSLIKDFQTHPLTDEFLHFDLLEVDEKKEVKIQVPVKLNGTPKGVKEGGILELLQDFIEVICMVSNIPNEIEIDVTHLEIGFSVHLKDIPVPKNARFTQDLSTVIAVVTGEDEKPAEEPTESK